MAKRIRMPAKTRKSASVCRAAPSILSTRGLAGALVYASAEEMCVALAEPPNAHHTANWAAYRLSVLDPNRPRPEIYPAPPVTNPFGPVFPMTGFEEYEEIPNRVSGEDWNGLDQDPVRRSPREIRPE